MSRNYQISGESMVYVKGDPNSGIASLSELGLPYDAIQVTVNPLHKDVKLDAWGGETGPPNDIQVMLADVTLVINLIHYDPNILDACMRESMGGTATIGTVTRAGRLLGGGVARLTVGNHFIGLNIAAPQSGKPYRFYTAYLTTNPVMIPLGTEKSIVKTSWRAIPYSTDPWGSGSGASGAIIWDNVLDT